MRVKLHKYSFAIILAVTAFVSCSKTPKGILSEKKMKAVLIDMQLAENMISSNYLAYPDSAHKGALYQAVFRKHNITQAIYDSSLVWYGKNLDMLMSVYELALNDINGQIRDLGDVQTNVAPSANQDSFNIWPRRDYLTLYPGAIFNGTVFDIKPGQEYMAGSIFVLSMRVWGISSHIRYTPEIRIAAELPDTTFVISQKLTHDGYQEITLSTPATKRTQRVYGYIRMDNTETQYYKIYMDSLRLVKYNYGSVLLKQTTDSTN
jgi:hypothetical protein